MSELIDEVKRIVAQVEADRAAHPERTALEDLLAEQFSWTPSTMAAVRKLADAILAAGYRKPRQVSTVAELDALPVGSVILDRDGMSLHKTPWDLSGTGWNASNGTRDVGREEIEAGCFPATVLYTPDAPTETGTQA